MNRQQRDLFGSPIVVDGVDRVAQLPLPLGWPSSAPNVDAPFLVGESNAEATAYLDMPDRWPIPVALLVGPRLSGRSTLARRFVLATGGTVIDDAERCDEHAIFHAWNAASMTGPPLLLVSDRPAAGWNVSIVDLKTRLAAVPTVTIGAPDLALMAALIDQHLSVHSSGPASGIGRFAAERMERSYVAVHAAIDELNRAFTIGGKRATLTNIRGALANAGLVACPADAVHG
jgi:hypothetical protein